ncbi:MAG: peptide deformylase [Gammaproteobacteria bacterium]|nr:peptide deformylase [Gammaproteobacteria bacterium]
MAVREILRMGHPLLRRRARPLTDAERASAALRTLITDMQDTLEAAGGVGLAAPQIGESVRLAIIRIPGGGSRYGELEPVPLSVYLNPEIEVLEPETRGFWEGCLSIPGLRGWVERPQAIRVRWTDPDGRRHETRHDGFLATVFQHEFDHLDGRLYPDRMTDLTRLVFESELDRHLADTGEI